MAFPQAQIQSGISRRPYMVSSKPDWNGTIHCSPISNLSAMLSPDMTHACMCVTRKISQSSTLTTYCCLHQRNNLHTVSAQRGLSEHTYCPYHGQREGREGRIISWQ